MEDSASSSTATSKPKKEIKKLEPQTVVLSPTKVSAREIEQKEKEAENPVVSPKKPALPRHDKDYYTYKLVGVVVHNGNADGGHYYSYINVDRQEREDDPKYLLTEKDRWVEFNDSHIAEFDFAKLQSECFGGTREDDFADEAAKLISGQSKSAYMLLYEKRRKLRVPIKVDPNSLMQLESDLVISSLDKIDLYPTAQEQQRVIFKDSAQNACYMMHPFHKLPLSIPASIESVRFPLVTPLIRV